MSSPNAPSVSYTLGRSRFLGGLLLFLWGLATAVTLAWWGSAAPGAWEPSLGGAALLLSGWGLVLGWLRMPAGSLHWDGQQWTWQSAGYLSTTVVDAPELVLDLQRLLLMRMHNQAGAAWLVWADATIDPGHWLDLRRALSARPHNGGVAPASGDPDARS